MQLPMAATDPIGFYSTAASVIPVIMLALASQFGGSGFRFIPEHVLPPERDPVRRVNRDAWIALYSLIMLAVLLVGEAVSLLVVAVGRPQPWWGATVAVALVIGWAGLVIPIVVAQVNSIGEGRGRGRVARNGAAVAGKSLLGVAAVAAFIGVAYATLAPSRATVPNLVGKRSAFEAEQELQQVGLKLSPLVREQVTDGVPPGIVVAQAPAAGTSVEQDSEVALSVGVSRRTVSVPRATGGTVAAAGKTLRAAGLTLGSVTPKGLGDRARVESQIPAAGERVRAGSSVDVFVTSEGSPRQP
jgi:hypothetical protein